MSMTSTAVSLFPNAIIPLGRIGFPVNYFWPVDKRTTRLDWVYYAPAPDGADGYDPDDLREVGAQIILSNTDRAVLTVALTGAPDRVADAFFRNMTQRAGDLLRGGQHAHRGVVPARPGDEHNDLALGVGNDAVQDEDIVRIVGRIEDSGNGIVSSYGI